MSKAKSFIKAFIKAFTKHFHKLLYNKVLRRTQMTQIKAKVSLFSIISFHGFDFFFLPTQICCFCVITAKNSVLCRFRSLMSHLSAKWTN